MKSKRWPAPLLAVAACCALAALAPDARAQQRSFYQQVPGYKTQEIGKPTGARSGGGDPSRTTLFSGDFRRQVM